MKCFPVYTKEIYLLTGKCNYFFHVDCDSCHPQFWTVHCFLKSSSPCPSLLFCSRAALTCTACLLFHLLYFCKPVIRWCPSPLWQIMTDSVIPGQSLNPHRAVCNEPPPPYIQTLIFLTFPGLSLWSEAEKKPWQLCALHYFGPYGFGSWDLGALMIMTHLRQYNSFHLFLKFDSLNVWTNRSSCNGFCLG